MASSDGNPSANINECEQTEQVAEEFALDTAGLDGAGHSESKANPHARHAGRLDTVPLSRLVPGKGVRGGKIDATKLVDTLRRCQQSTVLVRLVRGSKKFQIISGHRRVRAMQLLGFRHIDVKVVDVDDSTAEAMSLEENLYRRDLPDPDAAMARLVALYEAETPSRRGGDRRSKAYTSSGHGGRLIQSAAGKVAAAVNRSDRQVRRSAKIQAKATDPVKAALAEKKITQTDAEKLAGIPPGEQESALSLAVKRREMETASPIGILFRAIDKSRRVLETKSVRIEPDELERLKTTLTGLLEKLASLVSGRAA